jgi:hypothetical protein
MSETVNRRAAPHLPAGILSPQAAGQSHMAGHFPRHPGSRSEAEAIRDPLSGAAGFATRVLKRTEARAGPFLTILRPKDPGSASASRPWPG